MTNHTKPKHWAELLDALKLRPWFPNLWLPNNRATQGAGSNSRKSRRAAAAIRRWLFNCAPLRRAALKAAQELDACLPGSQLLQTGSSRAASGHQVNQNTPSTGTLLLALPETGPQGHPQGCHNPVLRKVSPALRACSFAGRIAGSKAV